MFELLYWLLTDAENRCPRCNYPVLRDTVLCNNCGQPIKWN